VRGDHEYTGRALQRLVDFSGLLLIVDAEGVRESVVALRAALAASGALTARFPSVDAGDAVRVAAVPAAIRSRFEVTSLIPTSNGIVLTLGIPRLGRWVLVAQHLDAPPGGLTLRRLVLVDVADVGSE
jgi:hypothetical protein